MSRTSASPGRRCWFPQQSTCHTQWRLDLVGKPPLVHPSCQYIAGRVTTREGFCPPFDYFGFLFPNKVVFGARYGYVRYIEKYFLRADRKACRWPSEVVAEPMPIRYDFVSIRARPASAGKRSVCASSASSYCDEHLSKTDETITCEQATYAR